MNNRLEELLEQKRLLERHLEWLEREIAREQTGSPEDEPAEPAENPPPSTGTPAEPAPAGPDDDPEPPEIDHRALKNEVRRGCLIYSAFAAAFLLLVCLFIYLRYR